MKVSSHSKVPVYTLAGVGASRELPDWLQSRRNRSLKKDPEFAHRVELLQEFGFNEASSCVRTSEDGQWVMSTGTYKPQIHVHHLPDLSLSFARHTNNLNNRFVLISTDYSKSVHLQADRYIEFHTPMGMHYTTRIPRYGRDLAYMRREAEVLIPATGVNDQGNGEVFRLNLELGRFMRSYEIDVGNDDHASVGFGSLQGSLRVGSVNAVAIAEKSHGLMAFGTSIGTVEFWDPRCRAHVAALAPSFDDISVNEWAEVTAVTFHDDGLNVAVGSSSGITHIYDLRSSVPLVKKDQGFGCPIKNIIFLGSDSARGGQDSEAKILTADKTAIKIWEQQTGQPWTSIHPTVDLNHVEWCRDSGMILTANEGPQQHAFFIPKLGPAPKWCTFLDNIVEEMAEDPNDPNSFNGQIKTGQVFDNFKFVTLPQLQELHLDHLVGTTKLLRPYMHGFFISPKLYDEARLISNPNLLEEQRYKSIQEKIAKERESRVRGKKKLAVKVNRKLVERMLEREEKNERRKAQRIISRGGDDDYVDNETKARAAQAAAAAAGDDEHGSASDSDGMDVDGEPKQSVGRNLLSDSRFSSLFQEDDFEVDETSKEFLFHNSGVTGMVATPTASQIDSLPKGLTAADEELEEQAEAAAARSRHNGAFVSSSDESESDDSDTDKDHHNRSKQRGKSKGKKDVKPRMRPVESTSMFDTKSKSSSDHKTRKSVSFADSSFENRVASMKHDAATNGRRSRPGSRPESRSAYGDKEIVFVPESGKNKKSAFRGKKSGDGQDQQPHDSDQNGRQEKRRWKDRRSASGNVMRSL